MSNLSELLPSGGGQNQVEFVASGTLPNGKPVVLKSNGQIEVVAETSISQSIPAGSEVVFKTSARNTKVSFDPSTKNKFVLIYRDSSNSNYGKAVVGTVNGTSMSFGSETVFNSAAFGFLGLAFDPNTAGNFVIVYKDEGSSNHGIARVGQISGTSISFGSKSTFKSAAMGFAENVIVFNPNVSGQCVIGYADASNSTYGTAILGTVSGTSISFGSATVFESDYSQYLSISADPANTGKFIITYNDYNNSNYGTAILGTISGSSISFGSAVVFKSGKTGPTSVAFDPITANKFFVAFRDDNGGGTNTFYGTAIVGTVSGTSISFGTAVVYNSAQSTYPSIATDGNTANKCAIVFKDGGNSGYATVIIGSISGSGISFGSKSVVNSGESTNPSISFDSKSTGKFVVTYKDEGNSDYGTAIIGQMAATSTNLTATNLIGIAAEATSSGATAKINTWGGINEAQTSLTIGSDYYAQTNGTITTATGGQKLGTAISATTINMRDLP